MVVPFSSSFRVCLAGLRKADGHTVGHHPLAEKLQTCQSVQSVTALLQEQARSFSKFRGNDKIIKSLKSVVSTLSRVLASAALGQAIGMASLVCPRPPGCCTSLTSIQSFPPATAIHTGLGILLAACVFFRFDAYFFVTPRYLRRSRASVPTSMFS